MTVQHQKFHYFVGYFKYCVTNIGKTSDLHLVNRFRWLILAEIKKNGETEMSGIIDKLFNQGNLKLQPNT